MKVERWMRRGFLGGTARRAAVALCVLTLVGSVSAQEVSPANPRTPEQIIDQLIKVMENKGIDPRRQQQQCDRLIDELSKLGDKAIPAIKSVVVGAKLYVQDALMNSLGEINTPLATDTLLEFALRRDDKLVSEVAISRLSLRTIHRPLSQNEFSQLETKLKTDPEPQALSNAKFLARCRQNDITRRAKAIIARFIWQLNHPPKFRVFDSYVSSEAWWCNAYILCLLEMDQARVRKLLKDELEKAKSKRVATWLTIASGMLGEESLAEELCRIVESEPDISVRAMALSGYAMAVKGKAIPFLRRFINYRIPGAADSKSNYSNPLQIAARDELARLEEKRP